MSVNHGANLYDLSSKYGFSKDEFMDFSSNINPFGTSNKAKEYIINNINMVSMYPDPEYVSLKKSISKYCNCLDENIVLGSGATELISSFIKTVNPKKTLLLSPAYSEYEHELNKIGSDIIKFFSKEENNFAIDLEELVTAINKGNYDLTIICNPNNHTGFAFSRDEIEYILKNTNCYIMIDETYIEFTDTNTYSSTKLVDNYDKLFVIRGTSKFFSTPGIRLGYGLMGNKEVKNKIRVYNTEDVLKEFFTRNIPESVCSNLYSSELWSKLRFVEGEINEDTNVIYKLLVGSKKTVVMDAQFYGYRKRYGSITNSGYSEKFKVVTEHMSYLENDVKRKHPDVMPYLYHFVGTHYFCLLNSILDSENFELYKSEYELYRKEFKRLVYYFIRWEKFQWKEYVIALLLILPFGEKIRRIFK